MMLNELIKPYRVILASQSPRRQWLLKELGIDYDIRRVDVDESYPPGLKHREIAVYLSELKASSFSTEELCNNCLVITADTIVWLDDRVLLKPVDESDAKKILQTISGRMHEVITGVTLRTIARMHTFHSITRVWFKPLTVEEIEYYVNHFKPFDKAGAYGGQEWIGYIGIERIEGSYFNVVGLPVHQLYSELTRFLQAGP